MNGIKILSAIGLLASFCACDPPVTFDEPQPANTDNLTEFPDRLQGQYASLADNSTLLIGDKVIQRVYDLDEKFNSNELDGTMRISGDTLIDGLTKEKLIFKREGDTIIVRVHNIDTLFAINYDNVVKKFKGFYFLNMRCDKASWEVRKMQLKRGQLVISSISNAADIESLQKITESSSDTIPPYNFKATKKQFKKFVKSGGFSDGETFVRLRQGG